jgi:hypothetical protein
MSGRLHFLFFDSRSEYWLDIAPNNIEANMEGSS